MIQRRTQTAAYWQQQFEIDDADVAPLTELILESGIPVPTETLALKVIERHCREEERLIRVEMSKGLAYQPSDTYTVGASIIFPALNYALGTVVGTRKGRNPEYGDFVVIEVAFEGQDGFREFASELVGEHALNREDGNVSLAGSVDLLPPAELFVEYETDVRETLDFALEDRSEYVRFGDAWFLRDLLVDISTVHLHLAEALVEIRGMPLPAGEFLSDLDLPAEVPEEIRLLSLNLALEEDERFDNVGDAGQEVWYLQRLTPASVIEPPARLRLVPEPYDRSEIDQELLLIEREIDDEGSGEDVMGTSRPLYRTTISLTYPHWREGTLPLTIRTRGLFPAADTHHTPIILVDSETGDKMQGWVVHEESFVYGLGDWYARHKLPAGALIKIERTRDPRVVRVGFESRRLKRLWVPSAQVKGKNLQFHMLKMPIACEFDEQLVIGEDDAAAADRLWAEVADSGDSVYEIMVRIMPSLVELSPQGTVHAKLIYSAVNVLRRTAPGRVFALLSTKPCFVSMSGGYWTFDPALIQP